MAWTRMQANILGRSIVGTVKSRSRTGLADDRQDFGPVEKFRERIEIIFFSVKISATQ